MEFPLCCFSAVLARALIDRGRRDDRVELLLLLQRESEEKHFDDAVRLSRPAMSCVLQPRPIVLFIETHRHVQP